MPSTLPGTLPHVDFLRLAGSRHFDALVDEVVAAIGVARDAGRRGLLVDARPLEHLAPPSVADRAVLARRCATASGGRVAVAMLLAEHLVDPERVGVVFAAQYGLLAQAFLDPEEAIGWLRDVTAGV